MHFKPVISQLFLTRDLIFSIQQVQSPAGHCTSTNTLAWLVASFTKPGCSKHSTTSQITAQVHGILEKSVSVLFFLVHNFVLKLLFWVPSLKGAHYGFTLVLFSENSHLV